MAIESGARPYVRVAGTGKPELIQSTPAPVKVAPSKTTTPVFNKPGIKAGYENGQLVTRVTLRPGESSNLQWQKTPETTTITPVTNIDKLLSLPDGSDKAAAIKAFSQGGTVTLTSTTSGYELKGYTTNPIKSQGITPARRMSTGEIISEKFTGPGKTLWYGNQKGPEQVAYGPDLRYETGPSTKAIMAGVVADIGVGVGLGGVTNIAMPAAQGIYKVKTVLGSKAAAKTMQHVFTGSKVVMAGSFAVGAGAQIGYTAAQLNAGQITKRDISITALQTGAGLLAFSATSGAFRSPRAVYEKQVMRQSIKDASSLNMQYGGAPKYGVWRAGQPGVKVSSSAVNIRQDIFNPSGKIGTVYSKGSETFFSRGSDIGVYLDKPVTTRFGKQFELISFGGSKAVNKIAPGVTNPVETNIISSMRYRTGEVQGLIKSGAVFKYTKLEPSFSPYVDTTPWGFTKTPLKIKSLDVPKSSVSLKLDSNVYTGGGKTIGSSGGLSYIVEKPFSRFEQALVRSEIMSTPIFNVYPPGSPFVSQAMPVPVSLTRIDHTQIDSDVSGRLNKRFQNVGFRTDIQPRSISTSVNDIGSITGTKNIQDIWRANLPVQRPMTGQDIISRQITAQEQRQDLTSIEQSIMRSKVNKITERVYRPPVPFPVLGFGGGESKASGGSRQHKARWKKGFLHELPIPTLKDLFGGMKT